MADKQITQHKIDASGQSLGRVASEAAKLLMGKDTPAYQRHIAPNVSVEIINASKLEISTRKKEGKIYTHYTGYPGGLRKESLGSLIDKKGYGEALRKAVRGMLPNNKLRVIMLKNLSVVE